jgi:2-polyprenyl-3-methyl-5-hydroxy-6-metoxy-1,4-benzoquinol methylase
MDINSIAENLELREGIWYSLNKSEVSYPEEGNSTCVQIEEESFWFNHRNRCITSLVSKLSPGDSFLDVGGGNGFVSMALQEKGIETIILEPGEKGAANAKKRGLRNIICSTLENAGLKERSVGAIGLFDVLEHIENDAKFLTNLHHHLKNNGHIYITVPSFGFLWSDADDLAGHFRRYTLNELNSCLQKSGFKIIYASYFFSLLPIPIFLFRSLPFRFGFKKNQNILTKRKKEHEGKSFLRTKLDKLWNWELSRISALKKIKSGSSCIVVAQKTDRSSN